MKASVKNTVDQIMAAIGPVFYQVKDYETIRLATAIVMAKVILSTPDTGKELEIFDATSNDILHALEQLLQIEAAEKARRQSTLEAGIASFANLTAINENEPGPALVGDVVAFDPAFASKEETEAFIESVKPSAEDENDVASAIEEELDKHEKETGGSLTFPYIQAGITPEELAEMGRSVESGEKKDAEWTNVRRIMAEEVDQCRQDEDETIKDA